MDNYQTNPAQNEEDPMIGKLIFDRYRLIKKLGSGSFGCIYSAEYENKFYAIKLEEKIRGQNLLENEAYIMSYLHGPGLPTVKSYGYSSKHNILVMELMGKSLEDIFESFVVKKMSTRCVCNIGYQIIEILEYIHNKHVIHRDIKPDNFVIGLNEKRKYIFILDFGLSKKFRSSKTLKHYPIIKSKNLTGTARYASINALNGLTQSRRDDLEAVGYVLMYFLRGRLPWQGIPVRNKEERYRKIMNKKKETSAEELCRGFPQQFTDYVNYTRKLEYEQDPDYYYLKNLFLSTLENYGFKLDCYYDWDKQTITYNRDFNNIENYINNSNANSINNSQPTQVESMDTSNNNNKIKINYYNKSNSNNISISNNFTKTNLFNGSNFNEASLNLNLVGNENNYNLPRNNQIQNISNIANNNNETKNNAKNIVQSSQNNNENNKKNLPEGMIPINPKKEDCCCSIF